MKHSNPRNEHREGPGEAWKRSGTIDRSVVPSLRGTGCSALPRVLPGKSPASTLKVSATLNGE